MKETFLCIQKYAVRAMMAVGALLGITSCLQIINPEKVYGPPPPMPDDSIQVVEDVYGPPVTEHDSITDSEPPPTDVTKL